MKTPVRILLVVLVLLVGARLYLPLWVTDYVNKALDDVPGYQGSVAEVDLNLYRGAYQIHHLKMTKTGENIPVPFLDIETVDLSIQWDALLDGSLVGEVKLIRPTVNFVAADADVKQSGKEADWRETVKALMPIRINRFSVTNGTLTYRDYSAEPAVNIALQNLQLEATNISNVEDESIELPSTLTATATSIGGGRLRVNARANLLEPIPDMDMTARFEDVSLPALNDFTKAYAQLDFEKGELDVYSEIAIADGILKGYIKPLLRDVEIVDVSRDDENPLQLVWEAVAGFFAEILENQPKEQFATKVPVEGNLNNVEGEIWPSIGNMLKNAFIEALKESTDNTISFEEVKEEPASDKAREGTSSE